MLVLNFLDSTSVQFAHLARLRARVVFPYLCSQTLGNSFITNLFPHEPLRFGILGRIFALLIVLVGASD